MSSIADEPDRRGREHRRRITGHAAAHRVVRVRDGTGARRCSVLDDHVELVDRRRGGAFIHQVRKADGSERVLGGPPGEGVERVQDDSDPVGGSRGREGPILLVRVGSRIPHPRRAEQGRRDHAGVDPCVQGARGEAERLQAARRVGVRLARRAGRGDRHGLEQGAGRRGDRGGRARGATARCSAGRSPKPPARPDSRPSSSPPTALSHSQTGPAPPRPCRNSSPACRITSRR